MRVLFILSAVLTSGGAFAQTLTMDGACPGAVDIGVSGLTSGGTAAFLVGMAGEGDDVIGAGPCTGTVTGLAGIRLMTRVHDRDDDGVVGFAPMVPDAACDVPVQVLDTTTCTLSAVVRASDGGGGGGDCGVQPTCEVTGVPDPATLFDDGVATYYYANNLVGTIWHAPSGNQISGHYSNNGYYSHPAYTGDYPAVPDVDSGAKYGRVVSPAATGVVVRSTGTQFSTPATDHEVGVIDPVTGDLSGFAPAVYSDGFAGNCNLISASATEFLCFDGTDVRHYGTENGSADLTLNSVVTLTGTMPTNTCGEHCFGGQFGYDGVNYYFSDDGASSSNLTYQVYDLSGTNVGTYSAAGSGAIDSIYFDWSACRYGTHDGWGGRTFGVQYTWAGGSYGDDSQVWTGESAAHAPIDACI